MTVTDQLKISDSRILQNEAQYDLDRKAAKISALSFNNLDKYEYLTGEDLGLKPSTVEQAKFEYFLLGKIFNKGLDKDEDKKEGLLKRLKNTEDKNEKQLKEIRNQTENIQEVTDFVKKPLSLEAKKLIDKIRVIQKDVDYRKLKITGGNKTEYDFSDYKAFKGLFRDLYYKRITIDDAEGQQEEFNAIIGVLDNYTSKNDEYIEAKNKLLKNVNNLYTGREKIIEGFKNRIFPFDYDEAWEEQMRYEKEEEELNNIKNKNGLIDYRQLNRLTDVKKRDINDELVRKHFQCKILETCQENCEG